MSVIWIDSEYFDPRDDESPEDCKQALQALIDDVHSQLSDGRWREWGDYGDVEEPSQVVVCEGYKLGEYLAAHFLHYPAVPIPDEMYEGAW